MLSFLPFIFTLHPTPCTLCPSTFCLYSTPYSLDPDVYLDSDPLQRLFLVSLWRYWSLLTFVRTSGFFAAMIALALEAVVTGLTYQAISSEGALFWYRLKMIITAFLPGTWSPFSLTFARGDDRGLLYKWRGLILISFAIPLA